MRSRVPGPCLTARCRRLAAVELLEDVRLVGVRDARSRVRHPDSTLSAQPLAHRPSPALRAESRASAFSTRFESARASWAKSRPDIGRSSSELELDALALRRCKPPEHRAENIAHVVGLEAAAATRRTRDATGRAGRRWSRSGATRSSATAASSSCTRAESQPSPSSTSPVTRAVAAASGVFSSWDTELTSVDLSRSASCSTSACAASSSSRWRSMADAAEIGYRREQAGIVIAGLSASASAPATSTPSRLVDVRSGR